MSLSYSDLIVQPSLYEDITRREKGESFKTNIAHNVTLNLKHKPGGYHVFQRRARPIKYKDIPKDVILRIISSIVVKYGYRYDRDLDKYLEPYDSLYYQICRMVSTLQFWEDYTPGIKICSAQDAFINCMLQGPSYADHLKRVYQMGMRSYMVDPLNGGICSVDGKEYKVSSYNSVPPYQYFVLWEEDISDWKYMMESSKVEQTWLNQFEIVLGEILPSKIDDVPDSELINTSSSVSRTWSGARIKMNTNMTINDISFNEKFIRGYRTVIPISPCNWRDCITLDLKSYFTMRKIDLLLLEILDKFPTSITSKSKVTSDRRYRRLRNLRDKPQHGYYVMRDIKKSGLTMPIKHLGPILRKVLCKMYPSLAFHLIEALENLELIIESGSEAGRYHVKRGLGLGMGNNLWTLIQCVSFEILRRMINFDIDGLFGNDDSVFHIPMEDGEDMDTRIFTVISEDQNISEGLGIVLSDTKTFCSTEMVFYEEYSSPNFRLKESRYISNLGACLLASNIYEAKMLVSSLYNISQFDSSKALSHVIKFWGYEFHQDEALLDFRLGGWISKNYNCLNYSLHDIYKHPRILNKIRGCLYACKVRSTIKKIKPTFNMFDIDRPGCKSKGIKLNKAIPLDKISGVDHLFLTRTELCKQFDIINKYTVNLSNDTRKICSIRQRVYQRERRTCSIFELSKLIKENYNDLSIPDEEVTSTTRAYDLITNVDANPYGATEGSQHITLCKLHDEGYIDYDKRYIRYISYKNILEVTSTGVGRVQLDVMTKEYDQYCKNTEALLYDWIERHNQYERHPEIPCFFTDETPVRKYELEDEIIATKSNIIIPLRNIYLNWRDHVPVKNILDLNEYLISIQDEWLKQRDYTEEVIDYVVKKRCQTHIDTCGVVFSEAIMSGRITPTGNDPNCPDCLVEQDLHDLYKMSLTAKEPEVISDKPLLHYSDDEDAVDHNVQVNDENAIDVDDDMNDFEEEDPQDEQEEDEENYDD